MGSSAHRRRVGRKAKLTGIGVAAAIATGAAFTLTGTAQAASVGAAFSTTGSWSGGYTGQYVLTNSTGKELTGWKLTFDLPAGARITSLWNGKHSVSGRSVTVEPESWNGTIAPRQVRDRRLRRDRRRNRHPGQLPDQRRQVFRGQGPRAAAHRTHGRPLAAPADPEPHRPGPPAAVTPASPPTSTPPSTPPTTCWTPPARRA
ncbi:hypothetical protein GCM10020000_02750 [Streptomyces olivoverticillatus]